MRRSIYPFAILVLMLAAATVARAQWSSDPAVNTVVCNAPNNQHDAEIVSLGAEGSIVAWYDFRPGLYGDIYVQKFDTGGVAQWTPNGVALSTAAGHKWGLAIASDGAGGAIVAWHDERAGDGDFDIYARRVSSSGTPLWTSGGVPIFTAAGHSGWPAIAADGAGGAFIAWGGAIGAVQHVNASGTPLWTPQGVVVHPAGGRYNSWYPQVLPDDSGGVVVVWQSPNALTDGLDILAQRLSPSGALLWYPFGVPVATVAGIHARPGIISDDSGGAIISWEDNRGSGWDIYAQRLDRFGQAQWAIDGVPVCDAIGDQRLTVDTYATIPAIARDGAHGAILTWGDNRSGDWAVYAQRIAPDGGRLWTTGGVRVSKPAGSTNATIAADGAGGAVIVWKGLNPGSGVDIMGQRIDGSGLTMWTEGGIPVGSAPNTQDRPRVVTDGPDVALVIWFDWRSSGDADIYIQKIIPVPDTTNSPLHPRITSVADVPGDQGGAVTLIWTAVHQDTATSSTPFYSIWRAIADVPPEGGTKYRKTVSGGQDYAWEWIANQPAHQFTTYSYTATTLFDSMSTGTGLHYFLVSAHAGDTSIFFDSNVDSGYSVDNLAPIAPTSLAYYFYFNKAVFHWQPNPESDLDHYALYKINDSLSDPPVGSPYGTSRDTLFVENYPLHNTWYTLRVVDVHGNISAPGNSVKVIYLDIEEKPSGIPSSFALEQNYPNPFNPATTIRYDLPERSAVRISVFTTLGQEVATIVDEVQEPGYRSVRFDASALPNGIYFYRITAGDFTSTRKMLFLK